MEGMLRFLKVVREGHTQKMPLEQRLDGGEGASRVQCRKSVVVRGNRVCEGTKSLVCLVHVRNHEEVCLAGATNELGK